MFKKRVKGMIAVTVVSLVLSACGGWDQSEAQLASQEKVEDAKATSNLKEVEVWEVGTKLSGSGLGSDGYYLTKVSLPFIEITKNFTYTSIISTYSVSEGSILKLGDKIMTISGVYPENNSITFTLSK
jgi:hypothetical protein